MPARQSRRADFVGLHSEGGSCLPAFHPSLASLLPPSFSPSMGIFAVAPTAGYCDPEFYSTGDLCGTHIQ